ncbi:hypothetical protein QJS10_CPB15g02175 [Acorus calamus]|uniref:UspA domain-containing protein n=1 Tax=Acorus calamus TaxID=4465 RepID=A0AAV9D9I7_ACOCL|nr:hypothetical protein QJS10_CPB15g02175 [Acorus calamus]
MKTEGEDLEEKVRKGGGDQMKVMVGMDGSDGSIRALTWALDTLFKPGSPVAGSITLVHVQEPFFYPKGPGHAFKKTAFAFPSTGPFTRACMDARGRRPSCLVIRA